MLEIGDHAPDFTAESTEGPVQLYSYKGHKNVILIFYPLNNTPGCRKQLCAARDALEDYAALDAVVIGVNPGKFKGHQKFAQKHSFGFPLVYDDDWKIAFEYRILTLSGLMQARTVYVLDKDMQVRHVERGTPTTDELKQVLAGLQK
jgi:thioredoxin-dependent peroxiredoxin